MKEIREKLEAIHRKKDATIARGTAAVQKVMTEVCYIMLHQIHIEHFNDVC